MSDFGTMNPLGPEAVNSRIAEIQSRLDALSPRPRTTGPTPGAAGKTQTAFGDILKPMCPSVDQLNPLSGTIGGGGGVAEYKAMAQAAAEKHGVPVALFQALVQQESDWNPQAQSHAGAKGLCQLMDDTARGLQVSNSFDPQQSLEGGARYLRQMIDKFGDTSTALAAYNAGPGFVSNHNPSQWPSETKSYVRRILSNTGAV